MCQSRSPELSLLAYTNNENGERLKPNIRPAAPLDTLLIDVLLTVKAATLIFISGRGSAISPVKEG